MFVLKILCLFVLTVIKSLNFFFAFFMIFFFLLQHNSLIVMGPITQFWFFSDAYLGLIPFFICIVLLCSYFIILQVKKKLLSIFNSSVWISLIVGLFCAILAALSMSCFLRMAIETFVSLLYGNHTLYSNEYISVLSCLTDGDSAVIFYSWRYQTRAYVFFSSIWSIMKNLNTESEILQALDTYVANSSVLRDFFDFWAFHITNYMISQLSSNLFHGIFYIFIIYSYCLMSWYQGTLSSFSFQLFWLMFLIISPFWFGLRLIFPSFLNHYLDSSLFAALLAFFSMTQKGWVDHNIGIYLADLLPPLFDSSNSLEMWAGMNLADDTEFLWGDKSYLSMHAELSTDFNPHGVFIKASWNEEL